MRAILKPENDSETGRARPGEKEAKRGRARPKKRTPASAHIRKKEQKEQKSRASSSSSAEFESKTTTICSAGLQLISDALGRYATVDDTAVQTLLLNCRAVLKDVTDDEICRVIELKGRLAGKYGNPLGFLMTAVPRHLNGDSFRHGRQHGDVTTEPERPAGGDRRNATDATMDLILRNVKKHGHIL